MFFARARLAIKFNFKNFGEVTLSKCTHKKSSVSSFFKRCVISSGGVLLLVSQNSGSTLQCDAGTDDVSVPSLVQKADELIEEKKMKMRTPILLEDLSEKLEREVPIHAHEGVRVSVSKGVNLGTQVAHSYILGQNPMYQYRLVLVGEEGRIMNASTDLDFNQVTLDAQGPLSAPEFSGCQSAGYKVEAVSVAQHSVHNLMLRGHCAWETSSAQVSLSRQSGDGDRMALSFMQSLTPQLALGGMYTLTHITLTHIMRHVCISYLHVDL